MGSFDHTDKLIYQICLFELQILFHGTNLSNIVAIDLIRVEGQTSGNTNAVLQEVGKIYPTPRFVVKSLKFM